MNRVPILAHPHVNTPKWILFSAVNTLFCSWQDILGVCVCCTGLEFWMACMQRVKEQYLMLIKCLLYAGNSAKGLIISDFIYLSQQSFEVPPIYIICIFADEKTEEWRDSERWSRVNSRARIQIQVKWFKTMFLNIGHNYNANPNLLERCL